MNSKIIPIQFNYSEVLRPRLWKVHPHRTWYLSFVYTDDECALFWHSNCNVLLRHRHDLCSVLWRHRHQVTWSIVPVLVNTKHRTGIIMADEEQVSCTVCANFSQRGPRDLQAVKLDRYIFCIRDNMHFEDICWTKNAHTRSANWLIPGMHHCKRIRDDLMSMLPVFFIMRIYSNKDRLCNTWKISCATSCW